MNAETFSTLGALAFAAFWGLRWWLSQRKAAKTPSVQKLTWAGPREFTVAGRSLRIERSADGLLVASWPEVSASEVVGEARIAQTQTLLEALANPRQAIPTLDSAFDTHYEVESSASAAAIACTLDAETRAALTEVLAQGAEVHIPVLAPNAARWARAIDWEPSATTKLRAALWANRSEDVAPEPRAVVEALEVGLASMASMPVRIRRRWVEAMLDAAPGERRGDLTEAIAAQGSPLIAQMWVATVEASSGPLDATDRRSLGAMIDAHDEAHLLETAASLLRERGTVADVEHLQKLLGLTRPGSVREAAREAIAHLQAVAPGGPRGALTLATSGPVGGLSVDEVVAVEGALSHAEEPA